jgi:hypothetical protein
LNEMINLSFTENHKYQLEFNPPEFWMAFANSYNGLDWIEVSSERVAVVAENYSYLLDLLVQARLYRLSTMPSDSRYQ